MKPERHIDLAVLERSGIAQLLEALKNKGYRTLGPVVRDGAIVLDELQSLADLPSGWTDKQDNASYRLERREDEALFSYSLGPHTWKRFLLPQSIRLWEAVREKKGFRIITQKEEDPKLAFLGVRPCDLHAIHIQDRILMPLSHPGSKGAKRCFSSEPLDDASPPSGSMPDTQSPRCSPLLFDDPVYKARRLGAFIVAVNCTKAGGTCFCTSMKTGPGATSGFDIALTEISAAEDGCFVAEVGSEKGADILRGIAHRKAGKKEKEMVQAALAQAISGMSRALEMDGMRDILSRSYELQEWQVVGSRCLTCGNCTMVCPTCFCTSVDDSSDLSGTLAERRRRWDSCFTLSFSYIHGGGSVRSSPAARYRHWLIHKLATWNDQFGTPGCVGCGRCLTWCPAGIDHLEELQAIRHSGLSSVTQEKESC